MPSSVAAGPVAASSVAASSVAASSVADSIEGPHKPLSGIFDKSSQLSL